MSTYNGWPNRETWNTHLWITNDPSTYEAAREIVAECGVNDHGIGEDRRSRMGDAARELREWWDDHCYEQAGAISTEYNGPMADAWSYALDRTDWYRIAEALAEGIGRS